MPIRRLRTDCFNNADTAGRLVSELLRRGIRQITICQGTNAGFFDVTYPIREAPRLTTPAPKGDEVA